MICSFRKEEGTFVVLLSSKATFSKSRNGVDDLGAPR